MTNAVDFGELWEFLIDVSHELVDVRKKEMVEAIFARNEFGDEFTRLKTSEF